MAEGQSASGLRVLFGQFPILVADSDLEFLSRIRSECETGRHPLRAVLVENPEVARRFLDDPQTKYSGIFINPGISEGWGSVLLHSAHLHQTGAPLYLLCDPKQAGPTEDEMRKMGVQDRIFKPISYSALVEIVRPLIDQWNTPVQETISESLSGAESYTPILARYFVSGSKSLFDVYIRLLSGRFVKVLHAQDPFSPERLARYLEAGVTHFYILKSDQTRYLDFCSRLSRSIQENVSIPPEIKLSQILNFGHETLKFLQENGVSRERLDFAENFVKGIATAVTELPAQCKEPEALLLNFLRDAAALEHGVAVTLVASLLIRPPNVRSQRLLSIVGLTSFLHDFGLHRMSEAIRSEDETRMSAEERTKYLKHPTLGAEWLEGLKVVEPAVIQGIRQHHERRSGKGFPLGLGAGQISFVAEVVGMSDEIVRVMRNPVSVKEFEQRITDGFSYPMIHAFNKIFRGGFRS